MPPIPTSTDGPSVASRRPPEPAIIHRLHNGNAHDPLVRGRHPRWAAPTGVAWLAGELRRTHAAGYTGLHVLRLPAGIKPGQRRMTASQWETIEPERRRDLIGIIGPLAAELGITLGLYTGAWLSNPRDLIVHEPPVAPDPESDGHWMARNLGGWIELVGVREVWIDNAAAAPGYLKRWAPWFAETFPGVQLAQEGPAGYAGGQHCYGDDARIAAEFPNLRPSADQRIYVGLLDPDVSTPERMREWRRRGLGFAVWSLGAEARFTQRLMAGEPA